MESQQRQDNLHIWNHKLEGGGGGGGGGINELTKSNIWVREGLDERCTLFISGNGPSGISLSYFLSGHWPYYSGSPHPDEFLQMRLQSEGQESSIIEQVNRDNELSVTRTGTIFNNIIILKRIPLL